MDLGCEAIFSIIRPHFLKRRIAEHTRSRSGTKIVYFPVEYKEPDHSANAAPCRHCVGVGLGVPGMCHGDTIASS